MKSISRYIVEQKDLNTDTVIQVVSNYRNQNKNFPENLEKYVLFSVFSDLTHTEVAKLFGVPKQKFVVGKNLSDNRTDLSIFCVKNESLLSEKVLGIKADNKPIPIENLSDQLKEFGKMEKPAEFLVPKWDETEDNGLRIFIDKIKNVKSLKLFAEDKNLIYASLAKSNKEHLYNSLTEDQKTKYDHFIKYLNATFGKTLNGQRQNFHNIRQKVGELETSFIKRVESEYFACKGVEVPNGTDYKDYYKSDIRFQFLTGLLNPQVKRQILLHGDDIEFKNLGIRARNYAVNVKDLENEVYSINVISGNKLEESKLLNKLDELCEKILQIQTDDQFDNRRNDRFRDDYSGEYY